MAGQTTYCKAYETWFNTVGGQYVYAENIFFIQANFGGGASNAGVTMRRSYSTKDGYSYVRLPKVKIVYKNSSGAWQTDNLVSASSSSGGENLEYTWSSLSFPADAMAIRVSLYTTNTYDQIEQVSHQVILNSDGTREYIEGEEFFPDNLRVALTLPDTVTDGTRDIPIAGCSLKSIKKRNDGSYLLTGMVHSSYYGVRVTFALEHAAVTSPEALASGWTQVGTHVSAHIYSAFGGDGMNSVLEVGGDKNFYIEYYGAAGYGQGWVRFGTVLGGADISLATSNSYAAYGTYWRAKSVPVAAFAKKLNGVPWAYIWDGEKIYTGPIDLARTYTYPLGLCSAITGTYRNFWPSYQCGVLSNMPTCTHTPRHDVETYLDSQTIAYADPESGYAPPNSTQYAPAGFVEVRGSDHPEFWYCTPHGLHDLPSNYSAMYFKVHRMTFDPYAPVGSQWTYAGKVMDTQYSISTWLSVIYAGSGYGAIEARGTAIDMYGTPMLNALAGYTYDLWSKSGDLYTFAKYPFNRHDAGGSREPRSNGSTIVAPGSNRIWALAQVSGTKYDSYGQVPAGNYLVTLGNTSLGYGEGEPPPLKLKQRDDGRGLMANARLNRYSTEMTSKSNIRIGDCKA